MTDAEVAKLVAVMMGAFPSAKVTPETSKVYERMLRDLDYPAANAAVERLLATARFMPTVADIREAALSLNLGETRPGGEAWGEVLRLIGRWGARRYDQGWELPTNDAVLRQTVGSLGWVNLCDSENQAADRARFIELYDKLAAQRRRSLLADELPAAQRFRALQAQERSAGGIGEAIGRALELVGKSSHDGEPEGGR